MRTIFNYDEIFGTIVNRFIIQAVVGYPLTVYGKGGQTRGYLNIKDTLQCVHMSEKTPAKAGELRIFNQIMETFSANELAEMTQRVGKKTSLFASRLEEFMTFRGSAKTGVFWARSGPFYLNSPATLLKTSFPLFFRTSRLPWKLLRTWISPD